MQKIILREFGIALGDTKTLPELYEEMPNVSLGFPAFSKARRQRNIPTTLLSCLPQS